MQVTLETTSTLERKMRISVPADQVESMVEAKLKQTAGQVRIKGFRPGKVPLREVRRRFGEGIRQEVSSELMQSSFSEALRQEEVAPAGTPEIENVNMEAGQDLEFTAVFEVFPEVALGDFSGISVEKPVAAVTDEDLDTMVEKLREQQMEYVEVDRASRDGDQVNIDFEGFVDGEAFEGGKGEGVDIILGSGSMIEGFEEGLLDCEAGMEKELALTFPENYQAENLAGKNAVFMVTVNRVSEPRKPELDDDFFRRFDVQEGGMEAFREELRENMDKELRNAIKSRVRNQVMDGLADTIEVELPKSLVSAEIDRMRQEAVQQFGGGDKIDPSVLPADMFEERARKRVKLGLIVNAIVEQMDLKVDDARVREEIEKMASSYEDPEQVTNYYYNNEQQLARIQNMVLEEQVVEKVLESAALVEVEMPYDDAVRPVPEPGEDETVDEDSTGDDGS